MRSIIYLLIILAVPSFGQVARERTLYVIDSVAIMHDPDEDDDELKDEDIESLTVATNKDLLEKLGYGDYDKVTFIMTKEFFKRTAELKRIPTLAQMDRRNGRWYLMSSQTPYTGQFVEYYMNGRLKGKGNFKNGLADGLRSAYFPNGQPNYIRNYVNGFEHGAFTQFFPNGKISQEGVFKNAKEDGIWKLWYSTGKLKKEFEFKNGKPVATKEDDRFNKLFTDAAVQSREGNYSAAVKAFSKIIESNPNYSDLYFHRGTAYFYDMKFDEAIRDFDKAIEIEPRYKESISNRAFARAGKYEFKDSRTLGKSNGITILATKAKIEIPKEELEKICADLNLAYSLGDKHQMILDANKKYCQ